MDLLALYIRDKLNRLQSILNMQTLPRPILLDQGAVVGCLFLCVLHLLRFKASLAWLTGFDWRDFDRKWFVLLVLIGYDFLDIRIYHFFSGFEIDLGRSHVKVAVRRILFLLFLAFFELFIIVMTSHIRRLPRELTTMAELRHQHISLRQIPRRWRHLVLTASFNGQERRDKRRSPGWTIIHIVGPIPLSFRPSPLRLHHRRISPLSKLQVDFSCLRLLKLRRFTSFHHQLILRSVILWRVFIILLLHFAGRHVMFYLFWGVFVKVHHVGVVAGFLLLPVIHL